jgi:hypothetical protein
VIWDFLGSAVTAKIVPILGRKNPKIEAGAIAAQNVDLHKALPASWIRRLLGDGTSPAIVWNDSTAIQLKPTTWRSTASRLVSASHRNFSL